MTMESTDKPKFVSASRLAEMTGISLTTISHRCKNGTIPAERVERNAKGGIWFIIPREVAERMAMGIDPGKRSAGRPKRSGRKARSVS